MNATFLRNLIASTIAIGVLGSCTQSRQPHTAVHAGSASDQLLSDSGVPGDIHALTSVFDAPGHLFPINFDGNNYQDFISRDPGGGFRLWKSDGVRLQPSLLASGGGSALRWATAWTDYYGWGAPNRIFISDVNHDGKDDLVFRDTGGTLEYWYSNGSGFVSSGCTSSGFPDSSSWSDPSRFIQMDFSGDGFKDLVARTPSGDLQLWVSQATAGGCWAFVYTSTFVAGLSDFYNYGAPNRFIPIRWDSDSDEDLLVRYASGDIGIFSSTGSTFTWAGYVVDSNNLLPDSANWNTGSRSFVSDVDGDGRQDMIWRASTGLLTVYTRAPTGSLYQPTTYLQSPFSDSEDAGVGTSDSRLFLTGVGAIKWVPDGGVPPLSFVFRPGGVDPQLFKRSGTTFVRE